VGRAKARWPVALFCLLGSLTAHAAAAASAVWAIHGAHGTVYLAGSIHLLPAQDATLPAAFDRAYADSSKLVMELDLGKLDPLEAAGWMVAHGSLPPGVSLRALLGESRYARVSAAAEARGLPAAVFDTQAPWVIGIELADLEYLRLGFDPQNGVEEQLVRRAQADHKPTAGLETLDEELGGLEALPRAEQLRLLDQTLAELDDSAEDLRAVLDAWRHGDVTRLAALLSREYHDFPALYAPLVTARNQRWLPKIEQQLHAPENSLIVVGSLHLVGDGGLLELLRKDGYTATQLD
jgi:uncharacterized protein